MYILEIPLPNGEYIASEHVKFGSPLMTKTDHQIGFQMPSAGAATTGTIQVYAKMLSDDWQLVDAGTNDLNGLLDVSYSGSTRDLKFIIAGSNGTGNLTVLVRSS